MTTIKRICKNCGKEFDFRATLLNRKDHTGEFCSAKCFHEYRRIKIICQKCGKEFEVINGHRKRKYCSKECAGNAKNRIQKICVICGKGYETIPRQEKKYGSKCCSFECLIKYNAKINTVPAIKAKNRTGCKEWRDTRQKVLERDKNICQVCRNGENLIVHHIESWEETKNNNLENLITMCRSCHSRLHMNMRR